MFRIYLTTVRAFENFLKWKLIFEFNHCRSYSTPQYLAWTYIGHHFLLQAVLLHLMLLIVIRSVTSQETFLIMITLPTTNRSSSIFVIIKLLSLKPYAMKQPNKFHAATGNPSNKMTFALRNIDLSHLCSNWDCCPFLCSIMNIIPPILYTCTLKSVLYEIHFCIAPCHLPKTISIYHLNSGRA